MNICMKLNGFSKQASWPVKAGYTRANFARDISHALVRLLEALHTSLVAARRAEYHNALSDQELAHIGLAREDVINELLRTINQHDG